MLLFSDYFAGLLTSLREESKQSSLYESLGPGRLSVIPAGGSERDQLHDVCAVLSSLLSCQ